MPKNWPVTELLPVIAMASPVAISSLGGLADPVAAHTVENMPDGVTVSAWALVDGDSVFSISAAGVVTLNSFIGIISDQSYTVQATLSAGGTVERSFAVPFDWVIGDQMVSQGVTVH